MTSQRFVYVNILGKEKICLARMKALSGENNKDRLKRKMTNKA
jgi:hypothetical protein